jgi:hypothetical protein
MWAPAPFLLFRPCKREAKKEHKSAKKKNRKTVKKIERESA